MEKSCGADGGLNQGMIGGSIDELWAWVRRRCHRRRLIVVVVVVGKFGRRRGGIFQPKVAMAKARVDSISVTPCRICMDFDG